MPQSNPEPESGKTEPRPQTFEQIDPSERILLGPGPSNLPPSVVRALSTPLLGYFDPEYFKIMDDVMTLLRYVFQTNNQATMVLPATGGSGMEAALINLIEPGDVAVVGVTGFFAGRMAEIAERCGAEVHTVNTQWGQIVDPAEMQKAIRAYRPMVVATVHGETSTGIEQPIASIGAMAREAGAYFIVDTVASLGGPEVKVDDWSADICYSGSQKCLSAPPGLAPITVSDRALEKIKSRKTPVRSWYLDIGLHEKYWIDPRSYHHTGPALLIYALREALRLAYQEGNEARARRHKLHSDALLAGLDSMGIKPFADPEHRISSLNSVYIPDGIDDLKVRKGLMDNYGIEILGGLGEFKGKIWRIGLMGHSSRASNVLLFLAALESVLHSQGFRVPSGVAAAGEIIQE